MIQTFSDMLQQTCKEKRKRGEREREGREREERERRGKERERKRINVYNIIHNIKVAS